MLEWLLFCLPLSVFLYDLLKLPWQTPNKYTWWMFVFCLGKVISSDVEWNLIVEAEISC